MSELTGKEKAFVDAYIVCRDPKQAAVEAGHAARMGVTLIKKPHVKAEIDRIEAEISTNVKKRAELDDVYVLHRLHDLVERCMEGRPYTDRRGEQIKNAEGEKLFVFDPANALRGLELIGRHRSIKAFEEEKTTGNGEGRSLIFNLQQIIYQHCAETAPKKALHT